MEYKDWLYKWLDNYIKPAMKQKTVTRYSEIVKAHIAPKLGAYEVNEINPFMLQRFVTNLLQYGNTRTGKDLAPSSVNGIITVVQDSLKTAKLLGIADEYVADKIKRPKIEERQVTCFTKCEQQRIEQEIMFGKKTQLYGVVLCLYTGLRIGELLALTWEDIDLDSRIIRIGKTVYSKIKNKDGRWYLGTTKTEESDRIVYICDTLYDVLIDFQKFQNNNKNIFGKMYKNYFLKEVKNKFGKIVEYQIITKKNNNKINLVFTKEDGTYLGTDIIKYPFKVIHKELGIENCRFYDLRGSFATRSLRSGVEIKDVANNLGHKRIETTENYYIFSSIENLKNVTETFEKNFQILDDNLYFNKEK